MPTRTGRRSRTHIEFAATTDEVNKCALCDRRLTAKCRKMGSRTVFLRDEDDPEAASIGGLVGVCQWCWLHKNVYRELQEWSASAPLLTSLIPGRPIYLVDRAPSCYWVLGDLIQGTLERIPETARNTILDYAMTNDYRSVSKRGLRFETLPSWPGASPNAAGVNMDRGHVIRIRTSVLKRESDEMLMQTIAHELAHTAQWAEDALDATSMNECELDAEPRVRAWGFGETGASENDRKEFLANLDAISQAATTFKSLWKRGIFPAGITPSKEGSALTTRGCC